MNLKNLVLKNIRKGELFIKKFFQHPFVDVSVFVVLMYLKIVLFAKETDVSGLFLTNQGKAFSIFSILLIGFAFYFLSTKNRRIGLVVTDLFLSFFLFADILYNRYFHDFLSIAVIFQIGQVDAIKTSIYQLIHWKDFVFFIDVLVLTPIIFIKKEAIGEKRKPASLQKKIITITSFLIIGYSAVYFSDQSSLGFENRNSNHVTSCLIGVFNYHLLDIFYFTKEKITAPTVTPEELTKIKHSFQSEPTPKDALYGIAKGKNVIMIQNESLSGYLVGLKVNGQEITPHINQLVKESYYNDNYYQEVGDGHSSDAEVEVLNSIYPLKQGSVSVLYGHNDYNSLANILKDNGYYTMSAHGYSGVFWNRINTHKAYGFQRSDFQNKFTVTSDNQIGWAISDKGFFEQSVDKLAELPKPFFSYLITLQNHTPFTLPANKKELSLGKMEGTPIGDYLQSSHNIDEAVGTLIERLKAKGLYDNTVIVMYGDHNAEFSQEDLKPLFPSIQPYQLVSTKRVPLIIHFPHNQVVKKDHQLTGHIDVTPSMLHLLGIQAKYPFFYGQDLFSQVKQRKIPFQDGSFLADNYFFMNNGMDFEHGYAMDMNTGKEIKKTKQMKDIYTRVQEESQNSNLIVKRNLIKKLEATP
ncbi:LTA synthase family protein (plasmid) [Aneurinibacillus sp. Ricciae_BoGa-3]|uniref:LTA synthase family protein n=1 Tax=Aneurinibacillus sp. Ricciae_BoGa-3 TaxID=3022697 RepID=UPI002341F091|nr:LTA synthase family protein [Aneurinibacillus sp. Ricciae_BoGa-3]WCK57740.1 LTA synthase family protein [Aneurinibacillus sp. Ricciae_BoGa-3]